MNTKRPRGRPITRKESETGEELECTTCHRMLPLDEFAAMAASRTGKAYACRPCSSEQRKKYGKSKTKTKPKPKKRKQQKPRSLATGRPRTRRVADPGLLECTTCKKMLPREHYYRSKATPDGVAYSCKECTKAYRKALKKHASREVIAMTTPEKTCAMCDKEKPHTEFNIMATARDGLCPVCRTCVTTGGAS